MEMLRSAWKEAPAMRKRNYYYGRPITKISSEASQAKTREKQQRQPEEAAGCDCQADAEKIGWVHRAFCFAVLKSTRF
jgi:hypothetical protein